MSYDKKFQCKHIPTMPILIGMWRYTKPHPPDDMGCGMIWFPGLDHSVANFMPTIIPRKLILAKMRMLIRSGLVDGCGCGCRGDFELTQKGIDKVKNYLLD